MPLTCRRTRTCRRPGDEFQGVLRCPGITPSHYPGQVQVPGTRLAAAAGGGDRDDDDDDDDDLTRSLLLLLLLFFHVSSYSTSSAALEQFSEYATRN